MRPHRLLNGRTVDLRGLSAEQVALLRSLRRLGRLGSSYFEIERLAIGPGSPALLGRNRVDWTVLGTPLYLAARDIATRVGIEQGLILAPEHEALRRTIPRDGSMISVPQAASLIGISGEAVHKAIAAGRLAARRFGNVWLVEREAAARYREPVTLVRFKSAPSRR